MENNVVYEVSVPFEPLTYETLSTSSTSQLPNSFDLSGIRVTVNTEGIFIAELQVKASNNHEAKTIAIERVEELFALLATRDHGFRISLLNVRTLRISDGKIPRVSVDENGTKYNTIPEDITTQDSLSILKKRDDLKFEDSALQWREQWPDWLRTALKLNYLAILSHDIEPAFIIHFSALEVLTKAIQCPAPSVLKLELDAEKAKQLIREIKKTFHDFSLSNNCVDRLVSRISDTHAISNIDRISEALRRCGIKADPKDIRLVVQQRGAVVHAGHSPEADKLRKVVSLIRNWVQIMLCNIMDTQKRTFT